MFQSPHVAASGKRPTPRLPDQRTNGSSLFSSPALFLSEPHRPDRALTRLQTSQLPTFSFSAPTSTALRPHSLRLQTPKVQASSHGPRQPARESPREEPQGAGWEGMHVRHFSRLPLSTYPAFFARQSAFWAFGNIKQINVC